MARPRKRTTTEADPKEETTEDTTAPAAQYEQAKQLMTDFRAVRLGYDELIDRTVDTELPEDVTEDADPIDFQTPDLEDHIFVHKDVLQANPTYFDLNLLSEANEGNKEKARRILLWVAAGWLQFNAGREWDGEVGEDQIKYGVNFSRHLTIEHPEPDADDLGEREKALKKSRVMPFEWRKVDVQSVAFLLANEPGDHADVFFYEYTLPILEANRVFGDPGTEETPGKGFLDMDRDERVAWTGSPEVVEQTHLVGKNVTVLVMDARDPDGGECPIKGCDHTKRVITEWVRGAGEAQGIGVQAAKYDSPFQFSSFLITPGRRSHRAGNYNLMYRPLMLAEYVYASYVNYVVTTETTMARADYSSQRYYMDGSTIPSHMADMVAQTTLDGSKMYVDPADLDPGQIPIYLGEIKRLPKAVSEHFANLRDFIAGRMSSYEPNKFLNGTAYEEASDATKAAFLQQAAAARAPYAPFLYHSDRSIKQIVGEWFHAIRFWAADSKDTTKSEFKYYAATSGLENLMSDTSQAGELPWVSASALDEIDFEIVVETSSETLPEQVTRWNLEKDKWHEGVSTPDQVIKAAGYRDVTKQKKELRVAQNRELMQGELNTYRVQYMTRMLQLETDLAFNVAPPPTVPGEIPQGGDMPSNSAVEAPPSNPAGRPPPQPIGVRSPAATDAMGGQGAPLVEGPQGGANGSMLP